MPGGDSPEGCGDLASLAILAACPSPASSTAPPGKKSATEGLTRLALAAGFRGIDTANQRKHYYEAGVGAAIAARRDRARDDSSSRPSSPPRAGRITGCPTTRPPTSRRRCGSRSTARSRTSASRRSTRTCCTAPCGPGSSAHDARSGAPWKQLHAAGEPGCIGVSNVSLEQLSALCAHASDRRRPSSRTAATRARGWDREVRALCRDRGIVYQGFSLLTANRARARQRGSHGDRAPPLGDRPQIVFASRSPAGMLPLTGTSDRAHMDDDLASARIDLSAAEIAAVERIGE